LNNSQQPRGAPEHNPNTNRTHCHCRARTNANLVSAWVFVSTYANATNCTSQCSSNCNSTSTTIFRNSQPWQAC
jgi:hypothetical protein